MARSTRNSRGRVSGRSPHFVKVFFPHLSSEHLKIPPKFQQHISGEDSQESPDTVSLMGPSGRTWYVDLVKNSGVLFFDNGWKEFVTDHSLALGDFLMFRYDGKLRFTVFLFDETACEKEAAFSATPCQEDITVLNTNTGGEIVGEEASNALMVARNGRVRVTLKREREGDDCVSLERPLQKKCSNVVSKKSQDCPTLGKSKLSPHCRQAENCLNSQPLAAHSHSSASKARRGRPPKEETVRTGRRGRPRKEKMVRTGRSGLGPKEETVTTGHRGLGPKEETVRTGRRGRPRKEKMVRTGRSGLGPKEETVTTGHRGLGPKEETVRTGCRGRPRKEKMVRTGRSGLEPKEETVTTGHRGLGPEEETVRTGHRGRPRKEKMVRTGRRGRPRKESRIGIAEASSNNSSSALKQSAKMPSKTLQLIKSSSQMLQHREVKEKQQRCIISHRRSVTEEELDKALQMSLLFKSANPFCRMKMKPSHVYYGFFLQIPLRFGRGYLPRKSGKMTLWDPSGESWEVKYIYYKGRGSFFSGGWNSFSRGNTLEEGDVCIFELIEKYHLKVHFFRVVEEVSPLLSAIERPVEV